MIMGFNEARSWEGLEETSVLVFRRELKSRFSDCFNSVGCDEGTV